MPRLCATAGGTPAAAYPSQREPQNQHAKERHVDSQQFLPRQKSSAGVGAGMFNAGFRSTVAVLRWNV